MLQDPMKKRSLEDMNNINHQQGVDKMVSHSFCFVNSYFTGVFRSINYKLWNINPNAIVCVAKTIITYTDSMNHLFIIYSSSLISTGNRQHRNQTKA